MKSILFFFSALGAFNGLLIVAYIFFFEKTKGLSKFLLGGLILALSIRIGKSAFLFMDNGLPKIYLQVGLSACYFAGPFLFFYLKSVKNKTKKLPSSWKWTLIFLLATITLIGIIVPYETHPSLWNEYILYLIYWTWLGFLIASIVVVKEQIKRAFTSFKNLSNDDRYTLSILGANGIICACYFAVAYGFPEVYYLTGPLVFSLFLYIMIYGYILSDKNKFYSRSTATKYAKKKISDDEAQKLKSRLTQMMESERLYRNPKLKLKELADELEISKHHLSQLLNDNLEIGFANYVNKYRIKAACQLLISESDFSFEGIGYEVGFNSKSTFFTAFKNYTGFTPAAYQKIQDQKSS